MDFPNFHAAGWWLKKSHPAGRWQTNTYFFLPHSKSKLMMHSQENGEKQPKKLFWRQNA